MSQQQMSPEQEAKLKRIVELSEQMESKMSQISDRLLQLDQKLEQRIAAETVRSTLN